MGPRANLLTGEQSGSSRGAGGRRAVAGGGRLAWRTPFGVGGIRIVLRMFLVVAFSPPRLAADMGGDVLTFAKRIVNAMYTLSAVTKPPLLSLLTCVGFLLLLAR